MQHSHTTHTPLTQHSHNTHTTLTQHSHKTHTPLTHHSHSNQTPLIYSTTHAHLTHNTLLTHQSHITHILLTHHSPVNHSHITHTPLIHHSHTTHTPLTHSSLTHSHSPLTYEWGGPLLYRILPINIFVTPIALNNTLMCIGAHLYLYRSAYSRPSPRLYCDFEEMLWPSWLIAQALPFLSSRPRAHSCLWWSWPVLWPPLIGA